MIGPTGVLPERANYPTTVPSTSSVTLGTAPGRSTARDRPARWKHSRGEAGFWPETTSAARIRSSVGWPPADELEGRSAAQPVEIIGVLLTTGDRHDAGPTLAWPGSEPAKTRVIAAIRTPLGRSTRHHAATGAVRSMQSAGSW